MHLHRGFFMPIFSTMHLHRAFFMPIQKAFSQQIGNFAGKEHHKPGFLRQRRAPHRGAHRQRQSAGSHRHQAGPAGPPSTPAPSWPAWSAAWPPPACTRRSSSWWVITKPECSKRPSHAGGPFLLFRSDFQVEQAEGLTAFGRDERLRTALKHSAERPICSALQPIRPGQTAGCEFSPRLVRLSTSAAICQKDLDKGGKIGYKQYRFGGP